MASWKELEASVGFEFNNGDCTLAQDPGDLSNSSGYIRQVQYLPYTQGDVGRLIHKWQSIDIAHDGATEIADLGQSKIEVDMNPLRRTENRTA